MDRMFDPSPPRPTFPPPLQEDEDVVEERPPPQNAPLYYERAPSRVFMQPQPDMLEKISKETIILTFVAFFVGLLLGKSLTPVILKN